MGTSPRGLSAPRSLCARAGASAVLCPLRAGTAALSAQGAGDTLGGRFAGRSQCVPGCCGLLSPVARRPSPPPPARHPGPGLSCHSLAPVSTTWERRFAAGRPVRCHRGPATQGAALSGILLGRSRFALGAGRLCRHDSCPSEPFRAPFLPSSTVPLAEPCPFPLPRLRASPRGSPPAARRLRRRETGSTRRWMVSRKKRGDTCSGRFMGNVPP